MAAICGSVARKSAAMSPASANVLKKLTEDENKTLEDTLQSIKAESLQMVHSGFDASFSGRLLPGAINPSIDADGVCHSLVLDCLQQVCLCELGDVERYAHVAPFLLVFLI